jgi:hypothetical protein
MCFNRIIDSFVKEISCMKTAELITKGFCNNQYQAHFEWEEETEASDEDLASMGKCIISLSIGVVLILGVSLYFLFV